MLPDDLAFWIKQHNMTVKTLAEQLNVTQRTVYNWLAGHTLWPQTIYKRLGQLHLALQPEAISSEDLRDYMRVRALGRGELAKLLGVSRVTIHRWLTGKSPIPLDLERRLNALRLSPEAPTKLVVRMWNEEQQRYMRKRALSPRQQY